MHSGAEGDNPNRGGRRVKGRRSRNLQMPLPGVFVGRFPPSLRASELKTQVCSTFPLMNANAILQPSGLQSGA